MDRWRTERHPGVWHMIAGDWKATALKAEMWDETATEGGRSTVLILVTYVKTSQEERGTHIMYIII